MILRDKTFWNPPRRYDVAERGKAYQQQGRAVFDHVISIGWESV